MNVCLIYLNTCLEPNFNLLEWDGEKRYMSKSMFWSHNNSITCVSVRCKDAARPALSELDRYLFISNVDSNWKTWLRVKTVRVFFLRLLLLLPLLLLLSEFPPFPPLTLTLCWVESFSEQESDPLSSSMSTSAPWSEWDVLQWPVHIDGDIGLEANERLSLLSV